MTHTWGHHHDAGWRTSCTPSLFSSVGLLFENMSTYHVWFHCLFLAHLAISSAFFVLPRQTRHVAEIRTGLASSDLVQTSDSSLLKESVSSQNWDALKSPTTHLVFPGGGIFFYWQAGVVTYLREQGYQIDATTLTGASAGALVATLTCTDVDFYKATELALRMAKQAGVWGRKQGLQGIWGPMIEDWLDSLLPEDAAERASNRLSLLVTPVPRFGKKKVQHFWSKQDLIRCNMASVHLPWFLDGKLTTNFREHVCIDGSFLAKPQDYLPSTEDSGNGKSSALILDYNNDPAYQQKRLLDFVDAVSPQGIWQMLEDGKRYARLLEENGQLEILKNSS